MAVGREWAQRCHFPSPHLRLSICHDPVSAVVAEFVYVRCCRLLAEQYMASCPSSRDDRWASSAVLWGLAATSGAPSPKPPSSQLARSPSMTGAQTYPHPPRSRSRPRPRPRVRSSPRSATQKRTTQDKTAVSKLHTRTHVLRQRLALCCWLAPSGLGHIRRQHRRQLHVQCCIVVPL